MTGYLLIGLAMVLAGSAVAAALYGWPRRVAALLLVLGAGSVFGLLMGGLVAGIVIGDSTASLAWRSGPVLALIGLFGGYLAWRGRSAAAAGFEPAERQRGEWVLLAIVALLIAIRLIPLLDEVLLRPVYPWDAWSVWMVKPKAWFLSGHHDRFVDPFSWFAAADGLRTLPAANYPELSGNLQLLLAVGLGDWNEPLLLLPWLVIYVALIAAFAGFCRRLGCPVWSTALAAYVLASLPLLNAQIALAGYLDLWLAGVLFLAVATWLVWRRERHWPLLLASITLAVCMALLKREGVVWLCLLLSLIAFDRLPRVWQRRALWAASSAAVAVVIAAVVFGGWIDERVGHLDIPGIGSLDLGLRPGGLVIVTAIFSHGNWHLLGLLLIGIPLLRWRQLRQDAEASLIGLFLLVAAVALLMLFCLTPAAEWAVRQTATNRLVLQLVPCIVLWLTLCVRDIKWQAAETPATAAALR